VSAFPKKTIVALFAAAASVFGADGVATAANPPSIPSATASLESSGIFIASAPPEPDISLLGASPANRADAKDLQKFDAPKTVGAQTDSGLMSRYVVQADRVPEFRPRDLYTKPGLEDLGFRRHPGLRVADFRHDNDASAYDLFLEDERLDNIREFVDTAIAMTVGGDKAEGDVILRAERETYSRYERTDPLQSWEDTPKTRSGTPLITSIEQLRVTWIDVRF
jgi:hypothetical protein